MTSPMPIDKSMNAVKKKQKGSNQDVEDDEDNEYFNDAINMIEQSHYYESNGEIFCIDANLQTSPNFTNKQATSHQKIDELRKVDDIMSHYKISFDA